ncbi:hypothetical protein OVA29_13215 [Exiguobacterium sp. SL14]|nr:hypothetical protein [Exiguobacterium sp. SL14]MCY1691529.1 hypothetical protein [Exiguobacterium sp. SL14]
MAKRPLTPRECELVVCSLYVMELIPFEGIMERLESITPRDIIGPVARGESTREQAADALDQYIKVRRRRFRNVPPEHLWSLDDRIEQEALRMIRKRSPLSAGEKLQPKAIPHEMGDTVEMKVTEIQDRNNKVTLIGKVGNVTAKLPVANRQAYKGNKTISAWITGVEKKPALLHLSTSDYGKHQPSEDVKAKICDCCRGVTSLFRDERTPDDRRSRSREIIVPTDDSSRSKRLVYGIRRNGSPTTRSRPPLGQGHPDARPLTARRRGSDTTARFAGRSFFQGCLVACL